MIYLFDNCYLSTTNNINETCKQVWIGTHSKIKTDKNLNYAFDILRTYDSIEDDNLDDLFNEIHQDYSDKKTIIYCDVDNFQYVYSFFFNGVLNEVGVKELYSYDRIKENYRLGSFNYGMQVTGLRDVEYIDLPKTLKTTSSVSNFSSILTYTRIEVAYANAVNGSDSAMEYSVDRASVIFDGTPGFWTKDAEQNLPALISDDNFTINKLIDDTFLNSVLSEFEQDEIIANSILPTLNEKFGFDFMTHYFNVINDCADYEEFWEDLSGSNKQDFIKNYMLDPVKAIKLQLVFPNLSNFDSVNPIFWNQILKNKNNTSWLNKFKVKNGTYN